MWIYSFSLICGVNGNKCCFSVILLIPIYNLKQGKSIK